MKVEEKAHVLFKLMLDIEEEVEKNKMEDMEGVGSNNGIYERILSHSL